MQILAAGQLDVAEAVDVCLEEAADDGRGLVFDDDGRAGDRGARLELPASVDCDFDELAGLGIEDLARSHGLRSIGFDGRRGSLAWRGRRGGEQQYPAEDLDLYTGDDAAIEAPIRLFESGAKGCCIVVVVGASRQ